MKDNKRTEHRNYIPILQAHALDARADTDIDHTGLDRIGNVDDRLQSTRALAVQGPDGRGLREARNERRGAELGRTTTRREDGADRNILDQLWVDAAPVDDGLERAGQQVRRGGVLEASFPALGDGGPQGAGDHDVIGMLLQERGDAFLLVAVAAASCPEMGGNLGEALLCWGQVSRVSSSACDDVGAANVYLP